MLTKRGYKIAKSALSDSEISSIRKDLCVQPASASHHPPAPSFSVLRESAGSLYLPRCYAIEKFGFPAGEPKFPPHLPAPGLEFVGQLRPIQETATSAYLQEANRSGAGTIVAGCGVGKTIVSIFIMCKLKVKTLVVVNKSFLADQWVERIAQFAPTAKVGIMKCDRFDSEGKDVVVASLQTMISRKYPLDGFGLSVFDETHHMSARVFVTSLMQETTRYMLGVTATPERKDGLTRVFLWFIGSIVFRQPDAEQKRPDVVVRTPRMPQRCEPRTDYSGRPDTIAMITDLCNDAARNRDIAAISMDVLKDPARCLLILSERRKHLEDLYELLAPAHGSEMGFYIGGMKVEDRSRVEQNARVILASVSMAAEAFDCSRLNAIILATPKSDVVQSIGRVMRSPPGVGPVPPLIIDIYDPLFAGPANKRRALYKKRAYTIENGHVPADAEPNMPMALAFKNMKLATTT